MIKYMIKKSLIFSIIALSTCGLATQAAPAGKSNAMKMDHSHMPIEIPVGVKVPAMSLAINKDSMSGYNLHIQVENYDLVPPPLTMLSMSEMMSADVNEQKQIVEGHAHLYINGEKIQRLYGEDVHLPEGLFKNGINTVSVTLNNHGHMFWTVDDKKIVSTLYIDANLAQVVKHKFESFPVGE